MIDVQRERFFIEFGVTPKGTDSAFLGALISSVPTDCCEYFENEDGEIDVGRYGEIQETTLSIFLFNLVFEIGYRSKPEFYDDDEEV